VNAVRVVIGEDESLFAETLAESLRGRGIEVVGRAGTLPDVVRLVDKTSPDAVILDIAMPPDFTDEGIRAAEHIRAAHPHVGLLVLSSYGEASYAERLLSKGAHGTGYLLKQRAGDIASFVDALTRVVAGEPVLDPLIVERLIKRPRQHDPLRDLSPQELRVLRLVAEGRSDRAIAEHLRCQVKTVERYMSSIRQKLGLPSLEDEGRSDVNVRVLAVLAYLRSPTAPRGAGTSPPSSYRGGA
jgi:DNA-binding NarL/FixJ family response regulator